MNIRIGFIGAGRAGTAFGRYLTGRGVTVSGYFDRHPEKARHACVGTGGRAFADAAQAAGGSDLILLTTRDDQIAGACHDLCRRGAIRPGHLVGHMSGAHASSILSAAAELGAAVFSLHPLQSLADTERAATELAAAYFSLEGSDVRLDRVEDLLAVLGNPFFRIAPENKPLYHMAACILSNYLVSVAACGQEALARSGIEPQLGFRAMLPLIKGTIENVARIGPEQALTGPIARGDASTLNYHLQAMDRCGLHDLETFYKFMGLMTLKLAEGRVLQDPGKADAVRKLLES